MAQIRTLLRPAKKRLFKIFHQPHMRPFDWDECSTDPDLDHVITKIAHKYTDPSRLFLHKEDLKAEAWAKLIRIKNNGGLDRLETRQDFFKFAATCLQNHTIGVLQKEVFTVKRSGVKPPERQKKGEPAPVIECADDLTPCTSRMTFSLDDEESSGIHDISDEATASDCAQSELLNDFRGLLAPVERMVLEIMTNPSREVLTFASIDSARGKPVGEIIKIRIKAEHYAAALGISKELFLSVQDRLKTKIKKYMKEGEIFDTEHSVTLKKLEDVFGLHIPPATEPIVVKRLLTIAARDQYSKVTPEVGAMLKKVGAKAPTHISSNMLSCFGILYQKGNRVCSSCNLAKSCAVEAATVGLGEISISPKLLGQKLTRIPAIIAGRVNAAPPFSDDREEEIWNWITENMNQNDDGQSTFSFSPKGIGKAAITVESPFRVRFHRPGERLQTKLDQEGQAFYLPEEVPTAESIQLLEVHVKSFFT